MDPANLAIYRNILTWAHQLVDAVPARQADAGAHLAQAEQALDHLEHGQSREPDLDEARTELATASLTTRLGIPHTFLPRDVRAILSSGYTANGAPRVMTGSVIRGELE